MDSRLAVLEREVHTDDSLWREIATRKNRIGDGRGFNIANVYAKRFERGKIEVENIYINWHSGFSNSPQISLRFNRLPEIDEMLFEKIDNRWYSTYDMFCIMLRERTLWGIGVYRDTIKTITSITGDIHETTNIKVSSITINSFDIAKSIDVELFTIRPKRVFRNSPVKIEHLIPILQSKGYGLCKLNSGQYEPTSIEWNRGNGPYFNKNKCPNRKPLESDMVKEIILAPTDG